MTNRFLFSDFDFSNVRKRMAWRLISSMDPFSSPLPTAFWRCSTLTRIRKKWKWSFRKPPRCSTTQPCRPWTRSVQSTNPRANPFVSNPCAPKAPNFWWMLSTWWPKPNTPRGTWRWRTWRVWSTVLEKSMVTVNWATSLRSLACQAATAARIPPWTTMILLWWWAMKLIAWKLQPDLFRGCKRSHRAASWYAHVLVPCEVRKEAAPTAKQFDVAVETLEPNVSHAPKALGAGTFFDKLTWWQTKGFYVVSCFRPQHQLLGKNRF